MREEGTGAQAEHFGPRLCMQYSLQRKNDSGMCLPLDKLETAECPLGVAEPGDLPVEKVLLPVLCHRLVT